MSKPSKTPCNHIIRKKDGRELPCSLRENHPYGHKDKQSVDNNNAKYSDYQKQHRRSSREEAREVYGGFLKRYKLALGCSRCGYDQNAYALDFDHLDPTLKVKGVTLLAHAYMVSTVNTARLLAEITKCRVLCANCHRVWTRDPDNF